MEYCQVLEIIGLSSLPLSSRQIEKEWIKKFSSDRNTPNSYIYEVIRKLFKPEFAGQTHPERFLRVTYKETAKEKIRNIQAIEKDDWNRELKVAPITNNPRNWRYYLNLKGFLLYLQLIGEYDRVVTKTVNTIIDKLTSYQEFNFLNYFTIFGNADRVKLLVEIARELRHNLNRYSREYLRFYITKRCHEEISILFAFENDFLIKRLSRFIKNKGIRDDELELRLRKELRRYKINILQQELIPFQLSMLEGSMIDLKRTKQSNLF
jgi:hypothetical protein